MPSQLLRGSAAEATTHLTLAFNGTVPSNAIYSSYTAEFARVGEFALANSFAASYANETNAALTTRVLTNLGVTAATIGASSYATLASAVETAFAAYPAARGQVALNLVRLLTGLEGDATYGTAAVAWNNNAATAFTYSSNTANTASTTIAALNAPVARSLVLTTGVDTTLVGGAADDTYNATEATLTAGDQLSGGAGNDVLAIVSAGGATVGTGVISTGVETIRVTATAATTITGAQFNDVLTVQNSGSTGNGDVTFTGLRAIPAIVSTSSQGDITLSGFAAGVTSGITDAASVTLNGSASTGDVAITANGIETFNVTATGAASGNSAAAVNSRVTLASDALDRVTVAGEAASRLTVNFLGATNLEVAAFDASATTGGVDASITLGGSNRASITGGSGNDTITLGTMNKDVTVAGGAGTDTLVVTSSGGTYSASATTQPSANVSGFEILSIASGGTADVRQFTNNTGFTAFEAAGASATLDGVGAAAATITARATGGTVAVTRATDSATADTITVNLAAATPGTYTGLSIADEETITINSGGTASGTNVITTLTGTDAKSLTVTGSNALTITTLSGGTALATINAGAHTGNTFTITASNSTVALTATGSAGTQSSDGAIVNTITTGSGNDSITGGAFYDSLVGGIGNDTIIGGGGNDRLFGDANNDVIDGGDGDDDIDGNVGNDSLTGGAGNDSIRANTGNDTISAGDGNDFIFMQSLNDDDSIDGGAGTDVLYVSAPSTVTGAAVGDYVDINDSVTARITGVETAYLQVNTTGQNKSSSTALTVDMTGVTGMSTLWLDVNDGTADGDEFIVIKNFSGSTINLTGLASATDSNPESLTLDGTSQASLTVNVRNYATASTEATIFTGVEAVTVSGQSVINSANTANALGPVTAASASAVTLRTSGSSAQSTNGNALKVDSLTAGNAQTVALNAGNYDTLEVTQDVTANNGLVQVLDIDVGTGSTLNIDGGNIVLTGSSLQTATIDVLANGTLTEASSSTNVNLQATQIASLTANLGANSTTRLDIESGVTSGTVTMSSGSVLFTDDIGRANQDLSLTFSGTGDVDKTAAGVTNITLRGATATLNFGSLVDSDGVSIISAASVRSNITGTAFADEISGGAGNDSVSAGAGNDRLGWINRVETITISGVTATTDTFNATINGVTTATSVTAANTNDSAATGLAAAINATTATSFATASATGAVVTVTYSQYFGTPGATAIVVDAAGANNAAAVAVTTAGDNAGADTLRGGEGQDVILGGSGNDSIILTETTSVQDTVFLSSTAALNGTDTITGFITTVDKLDVGALTTATATTAMTGALTTTAGLVYFLSGQAAGAADTAGATATAATAAATWTNANVTAFIVIVDNNSTAIYQWTDAATAGVQEAELTLIATIDAVMVTGDLAWGG